MGTHFLADRTLADFFRNVCGGRALTILASDGDSDSGSGGSDAIDSDLASILRRPRGYRSVKSVAFPPRELVARYPDSCADDTRIAEARVIIGARACDLRALAYLDRVFAGPPAADPFYQQRRERQVIVSVDCVTPDDTCFCHLLDGAPHANGTHFDVNLTPLSDGFVVESGSVAGEELLEGGRDLLRPATEAQLEERESVRQRTVERLRADNDAFQPPASIAETLRRREDTDAWDTAIRGCVECGACTQICPTCHCFYLVDRAAEGAYERLRGWDSCIWSGYARMAGASGSKPNPRPRLRTRFANRFLHKYAWSQEQWGMLGCVGCGRCVEACPGQIDIRSVLREVTV